MTHPAAFHRGAGHGRRVVCFHSNASHSGQWRALMDQLAPRFEVVALDSYGAGKSPDFAQVRNLQLADEVALARPLLDSPEGPVLGSGDAAGASRAFIDFWMGNGAWARTPPERQPAIEQSIGHVGRWLKTLTTEPSSLQEFAAGIPMPVLYMTGDQSPDSSIAVAELLAPALPQARRLRFPKLGHMGPITHPAVVNAAVEEFLMRL